MCVKKRPTATSSDSSSKTVPKPPNLSQKENFLLLLFEFLIITFFVAVVGSNSRRAWRESYFYSKLNYRTRWEMCVAAIFRIRHNVATFPSDDWSEIVGVYNILYSNGTALKHVVAFPCNTSPETYLRTDSRHKFTVMLKRY